LAQDPEDLVRARAASNPATPPDTLAVLAKDKNPEVRRAAASNNATPEAALALLAQDDEIWLTK